MKPSFQQPGLQDLTVKKGRPINYDVVIEGEPAPRVIWLRQEKQLYSSDEARIQNIYRDKVYAQINSILDIEKSRRDRDAGKYTLRLENDSGMVECSAYVNVLDVPSPPR